MRHLLGISGGKDSAALAVYMSRRFPELEIEYYTLDTGKELAETYELIDKLELVLGKPINRYESFEKGFSAENNAFDHFLKKYGGYLPSSSARWCTKKMKLEPFELNVGSSEAISYVGIRQDESRDGFISKSQNIQTIFPFKRNIWSQDVIDLVISSSHFEHFSSAFKENSLKVWDTAFNRISNRRILVEQLVQLDLSATNHSIQSVLRNTNYPIGRLDQYPLLDKAETFGIDDVFKILEESGVGIPSYYLPIEFEVEIDGEVIKDFYSRSRSGCFFCFYQQKIEWVWLYEQHPDLFAEAMEYEKAGYTWMEESLKDLARPERILQIKKDYVLRRRKKSSSLVVEDWRSSIIESEGSGCATCFI